MAESTSLQEVLAELRDLLNEADRGTPAQQAEARRIRGELLAFLAREDARRVLPEKEKELQRLTAEQEKQRQQLAAEVEALRKQAGGAPDERRS